MSQVPAGFQSSLRAQLPEGAPLLRFAPSPTGRLHLGNARIAVMNALYARANDGGLILRMDDTDTARSTQAFADGIREDLAWLGICWMHEETQLSRTVRYQTVVQELQATHRLYPCYETPEELEAMRHRQRARGLPPIYNRAALNLSLEERQTLEDQGRKPHWRFLLDHEDVSWNDLVRGHCHYNGAHLSDPVLVREDGGLLYTLPSVVDDLDFGITHVIRGDDHVVNTAVQIQIIKALGGVPPQWAHVPLVLGVEGEPLSKRDGALSLAGLREGGIEPRAIVAQLGSLGTGEAPDPTLTFGDMAQKFDLGAFGRASPRLDIGELERLSARILHVMTYDEARVRGVCLSPRAWEVIRPNLVRLHDVHIWNRVIDGPLSPVINADDVAFLEKAYELLPPAPFTSDTWGQWTTALKEATGRKGRALFLPLRLALTGLDHGPDMKELLVLFQPDVVRARLKGMCA